MNQETSNVPSGAAVACSAWLARIFGYQLKLLLQNNNHVVLSLAVFFHPNGQLDRVASAGGQLKLIMGEPAILIAMTGKTAALPKENILGNLEARLSHGLRCLVIGLEEIHWVNSIKLKPNRANLIPELPASSVRLSIHGQAIDPKASQERGGDRAKPKENGWQVLYYVFHVASAFFAFLGGMEFDNWWRAMRANTAGERAPDPKP